MELSASHPCLQPGAHLSTRLLPAVRAGSLHAAGPRGSLVLAPSPSRSSSCSSTLRVVVSLLQAPMASDSALPCSSDPPRTPPSSSSPRSAAQLLDARAVLCSPARRLLLLARPNAGSASPMASGAFIELHLSSTLPVPARWP
ncbi:uncharacterized protein LOC100383643 [Zea mays]|uniref:Uncharacterized protein n=1 Tax=Zea mays TaxID=4577 RepID=C0PI15_MAIZE|nr:uncharacterized protein LOC100383643 [Zea mays]ACN34831.1 unknown [Zea mays]|eukprot:NP_001169759.1 uncharacterized protein LOC100383643 [Zea mays]